MRRRSSPCTLAVQGVCFPCTQTMVQLHSKSFCNVSYCLRHDPAIIWVHMHPIFSYIQTQQKQTVIHLISDGPTTQYRNKNNFYLWGRTFSKYGFKASTWNFLENSYGKTLQMAAVKPAADEQTTKHVPRISSVF